MGLESATTIGSLNAANPLATDPKAQGDDHLRLIKSVLQADAASKAVANTFSAEMILLSTLRVDGKATISALAVTGISSLSTVAITGNLSVGGAIAFGGPVTFSAAVILLSTLRVDGIASLSAVASTRGDFGAAYASGTITASTQVVTKQYTDAKAASLSPLQVYEATRSTDVTINTTATQTGLSVSAVIPTDGTITFNLTAARILAGGASGAIYAGLRINGANYLSQVNVNGSNVELQAHSSISAAQYHEWLNTCTASSISWSPVTFDIAAMGISTGAQTIELILRTTSNAATLKGATTTARFRVEIRDHTI